MILKIVARMLWVAFAFLIAACVALAALFALGAAWVSGELIAAAPNDPVLNQGGAPVLGMVLFAGNVAPALTALPGLIAVVAGEALRLRSWMYYVPAGGAALLAIPLLASPIHADFTAGSRWLAVFAAAGFVGGFVYWLLAGRKA